MAKSYTVCRLSRIEKGTEAGRWEPDECAAGENRYKQHAGHTTPVQICMGKQTHTHTPREVSRHLPRNNHTQICIQSPPKHNQACTLITDVFLIPVCQSNDRKAWGSLDFLSPLRIHHSPNDVEHLNSSESNVRKFFLIHKMHSVDEYNPGVEQLHDRTEVKPCLDSYSRALAAGPFAWRARSRSWIFIKWNATLVDCQPVAPSQRQY